MKKFGFTLAEVLITLGIIGVVAALTAPALVKNSGQAKIGPSLAKFVNTFETACEQMMQDEGINKLDSIGGGLTDNNNIINSLSKYMIMSKVPESATYKYKIYSPDGTKSMGVYEDQMFQLKDGSIIIPTYDDDTSWVYSNKGAFTKDVGYLLFDINGMSGNNKAGKEVFLFAIDNSGIVIPFSSNTYKYLYNKSKVCDPSGSDIQKALACTGKVADNGWKADY